MRKKLAPLLLATVFFPQTALAHYETSHQAFWYEPMHFLVQHYFATLIVGLGLLGVFIYFKKQSDKE